MTQTDAPGPRIDAAKAAANDLVEATDGQSHIGLHTYGTTTGSAESDYEAGCRDVTTLIPVGELDRAAMRDAIDSISPSGYTPISLALRSAADQLPADTTPQAIVLLSDGEDTCETPPCETAADLKRIRPGLTISTVGFRVEGPAADQLRCIADVSGGIFVQATNARQLSARLRATQNIDQAKRSLTSEGIADIKLGDSLDAIRERHPDFPAGGRTGQVVIDYIDCDFGFVDGVLDFIAPRDGGRTVDGVAPGTDLRQFTDLYGAPVAVDVSAGTVVYSAGGNADSPNGFRVTADNLSGTADQVSGLAKAITLCRCVPQESGTWTDPVVIVTPTSVGAVRLGMPDQEIEAVADVRLVTDFHGAFTELPSQYASFESSTINLTDPSADPYLFYRQLNVSLQTGQQPPAQTIITAEGFRLGGSAEELRGIYGDRIRPYEALGMNSVRGYVLAGDGGFLIFNTIDSSDEQVHEFIVTQRIFG
jgi:hypothetical protein